MKKFKVKFWRGNPQLPKGGYETTRIIVARTMASAKKKAMEQTEQIYSNMIFLDIEEMLFETLDYKELLNKRLTGVYIAYSSGTFIVQEKPSINKALVSKLTNYLKLDEDFLVSHMFKYTNISTDGNFLYIPTNNETIKIWCQATKFLKEV